jgi:ankyrin repeat protein
LAEDKQKRTPVVSASRNGHAEVVNMLLQNGAKASPDIYGLSPLLWASYLGREDVVSLLLRAWPEDSVDAQDLTFGRPPLSWAAMRGRQDVPVA